MCFCSGCNVWSDARLSCCRHRQSRVPGVTVLVDAGRWLLEAFGLSYPGSSRGSSMAAAPGDVDEVDGGGLARIHRAPDGRFVLAASNRSSVSSSSDDGGFLSRGRAVLGVAGLRGLSRASWRRPLVSYPSQLSLRSDGSGESGAHTGPRRPQPRHLLTTAIVHPAHAHHHYANQRTLVPSVIYSPRPPRTPRTPRTPRVTASSPSAAASPPTPWSPALNFSDLSSVRTHPTPPSYLQLRSVHERYAQELPSLTAIHEQLQRHGPPLGPPLGPLPGPPPGPPLPQPRHVFMPIPARSSRSQSPPRIRIPPPGPSLTASPWIEDPPSRTTTATPSPWRYAPADTTPVPYPRAAPGAMRSRLPPRHVRHARSAPELSVRPRPSPSSAPSSVMETSPESRSSSSGFGSKNTSQQNQSSQSGSTPPYRAPPPPPPPVHTVHAVPSTSRLLPQDWIGITAGLPQRPSPSPYQDKGCDVSVDGHYEFDAVFVGTPTRDERGLSDSETTYPTALDEDLSHSSDSFGRRNKYDNIEARVQAMKEEFAAFRQRQARRRRSPQLESVC